jgi:RNA polymerase sigma-70 factor (ECF subfamily)
MLTPQAYGLAIRLLGRFEDAEDAVQDAFLRLWRSVPSDQHGARLSTYFNTIVINRCRSARAARQELATDPDSLAELHDAQVLAQGAAGTRESDAGERLAGFGRGAIGVRLQAAIDLWPARQRMAIAMWAYADADVPEIARALEVKANAAHQLLHRARDTLRAHFEENSP